MSISTSWSDRADLHSSTSYPCLYLYLYMYQGIIANAYYKNEKGKPFCIYDEAHHINSLYIKQWCPRVQSLHHANCTFVEAQHSTIPLSSKALKPQYAILEK